MDAVSEESRVIARRTGSRDDPGGGSWFGSTGTQAALLALLLFLTGVGWALASPPGSSPDDDFHLGSIWCADGVNAGVCDAIYSEGTHRSEIGFGYGMVPFAVDVACFAGGTREGCQPVEQRKSSQIRINNGLYPPFYYKAMHMFVGPSIERSVLAMRLFNVALAGVMLGWAYCIVGPAIRRSILLGWIATMVPLAAFCVASTNPSGWSIIGVGTYWAFLLAWLRGTSSTLTGALSCASGVIVSAGLAIGSRSDAAAYIGLSTVAVSLIAFPPWGKLSRAIRSRAIWARIWLPLLVASVASVVVFTFKQSDNIAGFVADTQNRVEGGSGLLITNLLYLADLYSSIFGSPGRFGGLGWLDTPLVGWTFALAGGACLLVLFGGLGTKGLRKWLAVGLVAAVLLALPIHVLQSGNLIVGAAIQPRYVLPPLVLLAGIATLADCRSQRDWNRSQYVVLGLMLAVANGAALAMTLHRYVWGSVSLDQVLHFGGLETWWWNAPITPWLVWLLASITGAVFFVSAALMASSAYRALPRCDGKTS